MSPCPVQVVLEKQNGSWLHPESPRADSWEDQVRGQGETSALGKKSRFDFEVFLPAGSSEPGQHAVGPFCLISHSKPQHWAFTGVGADTESSQRCTVGFYSCTHTGFLGEGLPKI